MKPLIIALLITLLTSGVCSAQMQAGPTYTVPEKLVTIRAVIYYCDTAYVRHNYNRDCYQTVGFVMWGGKQWLPIFLDKKKKEFNKRYVVIWWIKT